MNELILKKVTLSVRINGIDFPFIADSEFAMKVSALAKEATKRANFCAITGSNDGIEASEFLSYAVDTLIGEGSTKKIFDSQHPDPVDLCDILGLIADVFHNYRMERIRAIREGHV